MTEGLKTASHQPVYIGHLPSSLIDELVNVASSEKDKASQDFLWGYVREQVEEEATALGIVEKLKRCKDEASILYMDEKLGER